MRMRKKIRSLPRARHIVKRRNEIESMVCSWGQDKYVEFVAQFRW